MTEKNAVNTEKTPGFRGEKFYKLRNSGIESSRSAQEPRAHSPDLKSWVLDIAKSIKDMEELFHIAKNLDKERTEEFLRHYKKHSKKDRAEKKIHAFLKKSKSHDHLIELIKKDLIRTIKKDAVKYKKTLMKDDSTDSYIKQLRLSTLPHKIKMFEATFDKKDFHKIKKTMRHLGF